MSKESEAEEKRRTQIGQKRKSRQYNHTVKLTYQHTVLPRSCRLTNNSIRSYSSRSLLSRLIGGLPENVTLETLKTSDEFYSELCRSKAKNFAILGDLATLSV